MSSAAYGFAPANLQAAGDGEVDHGRASRDRRAGRGPLGPAARRQAAGRRSLQLHLSLSSARPSQHHRQPRRDRRPRPRDPDVAWDHLAWDDRLEALLSQAQAVCFGTLAQRHAASRATIQRALRAARNALVVYDINLRQHFYDREVIEASLTASRWAKLNEDELEVLRPLLGLEGTTSSELLASLRRRYDLEVIALTRGERGCLVQAEDEEVSVPGVRVQVVDTVGAGDAFTAGLLACVLEGKSLADAAGFANRLAARVAASPGGTPTIRRADLMP